MQARSFSRNSLGRPLICGIALLWLTACDTGSIGTQTSSDVSVIALTAGAAAAANQTNYTPRKLPAAFYKKTTLSNPRGLGSLPEMPEIPEYAQAMPVLSLPPKLPNAPYKIGIGDVASISSKSKARAFEQISGFLSAHNEKQGLVVRSDGSIAIPEIGALRLAGLTVQEAEDALFNALIERQIDPSFSLGIAEYHAQKAIIGGHVKSEKVFAIGQMKPTLAAVIADAGGVEVNDQDFAVIRLMRGKDIYQIPLSDFHKRKDIQDLPVTGGDAIYVDATYDFDRAMQFYEQKINLIALQGRNKEQALRNLRNEVEIQRTQLNDQRDLLAAKRALDAVPRDYVYVSNGDEKQSRFTLPYERHATLADVLFEVENTEEDATNIYVMRKDDGASDTIMAFHLSTKNAANLMVATQFEMRPNDIVMLKDRVVRNWGGSVVPQLFAQ